MVIKLVKANVSQTGIWGPAVEQFFLFLFFEKNSYFNAIWVTFYTFLEPFEKTNFLAFESQLNKLNCFVFFLLVDQIQNTFKILNLGFNFVSDLTQVGEVRLIASNNFSSKLSLNYLD